MATTVRKKLTYADYLKIPEDGNRHEIIDGEWFKTPAPGLGHQRVVNKLNTLVYAFVEAGNLGRVYVAPTEVVLSPMDVVQPDVIFISTERASKEKTANIDGAPDLVIEVMSPSTAERDRREKSEAYERRGVAEYWLVDIDARLFEIREFGAIRRTRVYKAGQSFGSGLLPGLKVVVDEIFAVLL